MTYTVGITASYKPLILTASFIAKHHKTSSHCHGLTLTGDRGHIFHMKISFTLVVVLLLIVSIPVFIYFLFFVFVIVVGCRYTVVCEGWWRGGGEAKNLINIKLQKA